MPEVTTSGTDSPAKALEVTGKTIICDLFPGHGPMQFCTYLEKLNNDSYQITHVTANPWGSAGGKIPFRRADMKRLRDILNQLKL